MTINAFVRPYEPRDRDAVRYICCETGFMGDPMEVVFEGREVFGDMWTKYYTDFEPEHTWVAEAEGRVVGYFLGGLDTDTQMKVSTQKIFPSIAAKLFSTNCIYSLKTIRYFRGAIRSLMRGEFKMPKLAKAYPSHLHTNMLDGYRGLGLGKAMMRAWLDHLETHGANAVHLETTSYNNIAIPFYKRMGFETVFESPLTMYEEIVKEPVMLMGMGLKLR